MEGPSAQSTQPNSRGADLSPPPHETSFGVRHGTLMGRSQRLQFFLVIPTWNGPAAAPDSSAAPRLHVHACSTGREGPLHEAAAQRLA